jgi:septal ring factor EnvC (AmiA/AmiB activator)
VKEITDLVEKLVQDKTFSLDAVKAVDELKKKFEAVEKERDYFKTENTSNKQHVAELEKELRLWSDKAKELETQVGALKAEQDKAKASIYEAAMHRAVADAYKDAMQIVFKPNLVRETVAKSVPIAVSGGYPTNFCESATIDREG